MEGSELGIFALHKSTTSSSKCALQLYTPEQYAAGIVQAYPYSPPHRESLELLAAQQGEPRIEELQDDNVDDAEHAANWDVMVDYLSNFTLQHKQHHNPLPR